MTDIVWSAIPQAAALQQLCRFVKISDIFPPQLPNIFIVGTLGAVAAIPFQKAKGVVFANIMLKSFSLKLTSDIIICVYDDDVSKESIVCLNISIFYTFSLFQMLLFDSLGFDLS